MIKKISIKPSKRVLAKIAGASIMLLLALYGAVAAVNAFTLAKERYLDSYAVSRVESGRLIPGNVVTKTVEVPVVKEQDIQGQVNAAIKANLK